MSQWTSDETLSRDYLNQKMVTVDTDTGGDPTSIVNGDFAGEVWYDTTNKILKIRNAANSSWATQIAEGFIETGAYTLALTANAALNQNLRTTDSPTFAGLTVGTCSIPTSGTILSTGSEYITSVGTNLGVTSQQLTLGSNVALLNSAQTITVVDSISTGNTALLKLYNSAGTYYFTLSTAAVMSGNYTLSLPTLTANDTLVTLGLAQTFTGAITHDASVTLTYNTPQLILTGTESGYASFTLEETAGNFEIISGSITGLKLVALSGALSSYKNTLDDGSGNLSVALGISVGNSDLLLNRQNQDPAYITRPNVAGYKSIAFAVAGGGALANFYVTSSNIYLGWNNSAVVKTYNNILDDGSGNATVIGTFNIGNSTGAAGLYLNDISGANYRIVTGGYNLTFYQGNGSGGWNQVLQLANGGKLLSLNNTLDDGSGNVTFAGKITCTKISPPVNNTLIIQTVSSYVFSVINSSSIMSFEATDAGVVLTTKNTLDDGSGNLTAAGICQATKFATSSPTNPASISMSSGTMYQLSTSYNTVCYITVTVSASSIAWFYVGSSSTRTNDYIVAIVSAVGETTITIFVPVNWYVGYFQDSGTVTFDNAYYMTG